MQSLLRLILCFSVIFPLLGDAASNAAEDFYDDALRNRARDDILQMKSDELEVLLNYLASCSDKLPYRYKLADCGRATTLYQIKYARGRALDQLMLLLQRADRDMNMSSGPLDVGQSVRLSYVRSQLEYVARDRFRAISK